MNQRLFTPGPTPVPEQVMRRMAVPIPHHRHPEFRAVMARVNDGLRYVFQTDSPVLTLASSGTGGMEALVVNLFSPGDRVIAVNGGKFGERWMRLLAAYGVDPVEVPIPWGKAVSPAVIRAELRAHPDVRGVLLTHSETSTGTAIDLKEIARVVRAESQALLVVDGISSVAALELRLDQWGIDACVTASQKGLMLPPGLSFVALSPRGIEAVSRSRSRRFYFDLKAGLRAHGTGDTPWTPAISLILGLEASLEMIREEGIEGVWSRHRRLGEEFRAGVKSLGFSLFSESPSDSVSAVRLPEGVDWGRFSAFLKGEGYTVAGGQGEFVGKLFRVGHLGHCSAEGIRDLLGGLSRALGSCGLQG